MPTTVRYSVLVRYMGSPYMQLFFYEMRKGQGSARKEVTALVDFHPSSSVFAEFPGNLGSLAFLGGGSLRGILWSPGLCGG